MVLYEMFARKAPFEGMSEREVKYYVYLFLFLICKIQYFLRFERVTVTQTIIGGSCFPENRGFIF